MGYISFICGSLTEFHFKSFQGVLEWYEVKNCGQIGVKNKVELERHITSIKP